MPVDEPEGSPTPLKLCVELTGKVGKAVSFAAVAEELLDLPVENQALRESDITSMNDRENMELLI